MKSLTFKLLVVFVIMTAVSLAIGLGGTLALQGAGTALNDNNQSLQRLTDLLSSAGETLAGNTRLQESGAAAAARMADAQDETYSSLKEMGDIMLPKSFAISRMRFALADITAAERALLLALNMRHLEEGELQSTRAIQLRNIDVAMETMRDARAAYLPLIHGDEERAAWDVLDRDLEAWRANHEDFMEEIDKLETLVDDLVRGGPLFASASRQAYDTAFVRGKSIRRACEESMEELGRTIASAAEQDVAKAMQAQARSRTLVRDLGAETSAAAAGAAGLRAQIEAARLAANEGADKSAEDLRATTGRFWVLVYCSVFLVAVAFGLGLFLALRISRPMREMADHMARLAQGDLTADVAKAYCDREDEIGRLARAMQEMIIATRDELRLATAMAGGDYTVTLPLRSDMDQLGRALGTMVVTTNAALSQVGKAVERVGDGAAAVSEASRSLSQGAQTSASALEEISQTVSDINVQARDNAEHASQANKLATASREAARRGYGAVTELAGSMGEIQQAGKQIATVVKLIDDIAFQTNLLALNAAVEAARAGRQGKGFSVVADEVRNLSGRSAKAARDTGAMVAAMTERIEAGAQLAQRSDKEFREIVEATEQVARLFVDITQASNAQSTAVAQISQGLSQIDHVIQENTHNAGMTASSSLALSKQAEALRRMVSRFRLLSPEKQRLRELPATPPPAALPDEREGRRLLDGPEGTA